MPRFDIRFVSSNEFKLAEAAEILAGADVHVLPISFKLDELQTNDTRKLVKDKILKAFQRVGRPLFVEHTGLYLEHLNGLPGGLTQIAWDTLEADRFAELFGNTPNPAVVARTIIGYTDAKRFFFFEGEIGGRVAPEPRGSREFQWDCIFIPEGQAETFAQMGNRKNQISMRRRALDQFAAFLEEQGRV